MAVLKLRTDYLGDNQEILVSEYGNSRKVLSIQVGGVCHEPHRPALTTNDLARIVSKILEDNPHFTLLSIGYTIDGAILCFQQTLPESVVINLED